MKMPQVLAVLLIFGLSAFPLSAQTALGVIGYLEGDVTVTRGGSVLDSPQVTIGTVIEEFDTIETGNDGYAEVEMSAPSAGSIVKVKKNTAFYFEGTPRNSGWFRTTFQLLRGSLALKVGRLTNRESFQVQTDNAVMAVRGTEFTVDISADRSVLVTVPEGRVESSSGNTRVAAEPGIITVINSGAAARQLYVSPEDLDLYREYWKGLRLEALRGNARMAIQQYSRDWDRDLMRLESAMEELGRQEAIFRKWNEIAESGEDWPSTGETLRDKSALARGMVELRAALPPAERSYETLIGLESAWKAGYAQGSFRVGPYSDAASFYRSFQRDKAKVRTILGTARRMIRIYRFIDSAAGQDFDTESFGLMDGTPSL